ncbi:ATP-binding cassette transporter, subfamily G, member 2, group WBC protein PpABCG2 [Reticulomyxa filosa]|uniref:ATP-binding cassette transporter, subfamily G, member 2, group WBC protein PpABCG2 n=1 Tax=Reticulomyxa filosa TaxID=46433 RepID=X6NSP2_RETFI|nr:ATP-binding cassette transporter, subfamily G, member 2, group WBC protein PpABCG2 [Reticulomyxa filosa]|eukprot:ETO29016.1 ATP-binding cassette transporter, subfamily G, member 2, group WBC protein PpABCG2 [Reticulomyxa filosa]
MCMHAHCAAVRERKKKQMGLVFTQFDRLILLTDGNVVYNGKGGEHAVTYFSKLGFSCPSYFNPADYFLDIISYDSRNEEDSEKRIALLIGAWKKQSKKYNIRSKKFLKKVQEMKTVRSGFWTQLFVLSGRNIRQVYRNKFSLTIRLIMALFFGLFLSAIYSNTNYGQKSIQDRSGILFFVAINQSFSGLMNVVTTFTLEKAIVMRERQAKSYHVVSYYLTKFLTAVPVDIFFPVLFSCVMYWIVNLNPTAQSFFIFIVTTVLTTFTAMALGFIVAAFAPSVDAANAVGPPIMVLMILFGGVFINIKNVPVWLSWLQNLSSIRWSYMAFCINEFKHEKFHCSASEQSFCIKNGEDVLCFSSSSVLLFKRNKDK